MRPHFAYSTVPKPAKPLGADHRRALEMLAGTRYGIAAALLLAHGFTTEMLAGLAHDGLVMVQPEAVKAGGRRVEIARMRITDAGRRTIASLAGSE
jgi:hypothetical protein